MKRAYKFRLRPTSHQHVALQQCLDAHRELYNAALQGQEVEYYSAARLRRLTVYVGDDAESKPAWPGTHITVTGGDAA